MSSEVKMDGKRLEMIRIFDFPRAEVFAAWTEAHQIQQWWGCPQTERVESTVDLRVGGVYKHVMHLRDIGTFVYHGVFKEVSVPEKLAYTLRFGPAADEAFVTVEFIDLGDKTKLVLMQDGFPNMEMCQRVCEGFKHAFQKLDRTLQCERACLNRYRST